ncbi:peptide chain release factor N(5)-glutamine methyltransferase [soil metagenome]
MPSVADRLAAARARLEAAGIPAHDARLDAEVLARQVLGWDRAALLSCRREPEPPDFADRFDALITRRAEREPVAQIVGMREFWGLDFEVTPDVLIPRPETEIIVDEALAYARACNCRHVVDVGTGSGCLAVAIAHELPHLHLTAIDVSPAALAVARRNAERHGVHDRVVFRHGDLLAGVTEPADLIVANPPYVPEYEASSLLEEVMQYEPHVALFGGATGLEVIERLFTAAPDHLADDGHLIVEFGFGQSQPVKALAESTGWRILRVRCDLQSIPRTIVLTRTPDA